MDFFASGPEEMEVSASIEADCVVMGDLVLEREEARSLAIMLMEAVAWLDESRRCWT